MAYLKDLAEPCRSCNKKATRMLYSTRNAEMGYYCTNCSKRALARLEELEKLEHLK